MTMSLPLLTLLGFLTVFCVACAASSSEAAADVTRRDADFSRDDDEFGVGQVLTSLQKAHQLRMSLSQQLRSLNSFFTCLRSCIRAHSVILQAHPDIDPTAMEGNIRYFCNHNCIMVFQHHSHEETSSGVQQQTPKPNPDLDAIVG